MIIIEFEPETETWSYENVRRNGRASLSGFFSAELAMRAAWQTFPHTACIIRTSASRGLAIPEHRS